MSENIMDKDIRKYTHITLIECDQIEAYHSEGLSINKIARRVGRSKSTKKSIYFYHKHK